MMHLQDMVLVPYAHAGSDDLATKVRQAAEKGDVLLLQNHGVIVGADTIDQATLKVETLEFTSFLYITAQQAGIPLNHIPAELVAAFRASKYRR